MSAPVRQSWQEAATSIETGKLPTSLAALMELAIDCAAFLEPTLYFPDAWVFHKPVHGTCRFCIAGAVVARMLSGSPELHLVPNRNFDRTVSRTLLALNAARIGMWERAYLYLGLEAPAGAGELPRPVHCDFTGWKAFDVFVESFTRRAKDLARLEAA